MLGFKGQQIVVAALLVCTVLFTRSVVEATYYNLGTSWSIKNNEGALDVVKGTTGGESLRIIFMDNESSTFALAFFHLNETVSPSSRDSFILGIVTMPESNNPDLWTVVWSANRDRPVGQNATVGLTFDGNLALWDRDGVEVWSTQLDAGVRIAGLNMDKSGNLVLVDATYIPVWESFKHPTDTVLPGQVLQVGATLVAKSSSADPSLHSYYLAVENGGLALYASSSSSPSLHLDLQEQNLTPYWISSLSLVQDLEGVLSSCQHPAMLFLDSAKGLVVKYDFSLILPTGSSPSSACSSQSYLEASIALPNYGLSMSHQFVRLDRDGNIRLYVYAINSRAWQAVASVLNSPCNIPGICGKYDVCFQGRCSCNKSSLDNEPLNLTDSAAALSCNKPPPGSAATDESGLVNNCTIAPGYREQTFTVTSVDYFSNRFVSPDYFTSNVADCDRHCLSNCSCGASFFHSDTRACYLVATVHSLQGVSQGGYSALVKVFSPINPEVNPESPSVSPAADGQEMVASRKKTNGMVIIVTSVCLGSAGLVLLLVFVLCTLYRLLGKKKGRVQIQKLQEGPGQNDEFYDSLPGLPPRYTLKDLSMATNGFQTRLGSGGGSGSNYEGSLPDGSRVAVKRLEAASRHGKDKKFREQVAIIGSLQHLNLVLLRGFCVEGVHRLLVYEHMPKGSLDKWLFAPKEAAEEFKTDGFVLDWNTRMKIALGTAHGLAFLHEESSGKMIHRDVKPQNILLDEQFFPKVSDFGLAKLIMDSRDDSTQAGVMGTPGYLAPELLLRSHVSEKIDVYSYGIILIELLTGRKSIDIFMEFESDYFPSWAMNMARDGRLKESLDKRLGDMVPEVQCQRVIQLAYWCVHRDYIRRPTMRMVVQMLEGLAAVPEMPEAELADLSSIKLESFHEKQQPTKR